MQNSTARAPLPSRSTATTNKRPATTNKRPATTNKRPTLGPLEAAFNNQGREVVDEYVARCIYANGLAFNLVHSFYWQQMIKAVDEAPKEYKSPSYEKVHTTLLISERQSVDRPLQAIQDTWVELGVLSFFYGWRDQRNHHLINVIAICPQGQCF